MDADTAGDQREDRIRTGPVQLLPFKPLRFRSGQLGMHTDGESETGNVIGSLSLGGTRSVTVPPCGTRPSRQTVACNRSLKSGF